MNLAEYLFRNKIKQCNFADAAGLSRFTIWRVINKGLCNEKTARAIERHTNGQVTAKDLLMKRLKIITRHKKQLLKLE